MTPHIRSRRYLQAMALIVMTTAPLAAQNAVGLRLGATERRSVDGIPDSATPAMQPQPRGRSALDRLPVWSAPLASAVVPGLGQARLGQDRFIAFMAAEAFLLLQYAKSTGEARDNAQNFRAIARDIARRGFPGTHPDTSAWKYYESMKKYVESGVFTLATNGRIVPETDTLTYNGRQWLQARELFGVPVNEPDPVRDGNYARALARYESTAVRQEYGWSWRNAQLAQDLYGRSIARSNDAYRRATGDLLAIMANHVISAIDAFATVRLAQGAGGEMRVTASVPLR